MNIIEIDSHYRTGAKLRDFSVGQIKTEPMLHKVDFTFAAERGGSISHHFLDMLPENWKEDSSLIIDSRTHMLMPGWYPCIPGWHHDDVPRERSDGQPNYRSPSYKARHIMAIFGDASITEFATGVVEFPDVPVGSVYYKEWHPLVEAAIARGSLGRERIPEATQIFFDWQSWHQGTAATHNGWRFFIRASIGGTRKAANEIRHQTQVYMDNLTSGW